MTRVRVVRLTATRVVMHVPLSVWLRLPDGLRLWSIDQWLWSVESVRRRFPSPSVMRRVFDELDPGGA